MPGLPLFWKGNEGEAEIKPLSLQRILFDA
jgi:hypothetical protein